MCVCVYIKPKTSKTVLTAQIVDAKYFAIIANKLNVVYKIQGKNLFKNLLFFNLMK